MKGILVIGIYILSPTENLKFVYDDFGWELSKFVNDNILNVLIVYQYLFKLHCLD